MANQALSASIVGAGIVRMGGFTGKTNYLLRDYPIQFLTQETADVAQWLLAIFLTKILNYTVVGSTNFTANFTAISSGTASPHLAGINVVGGIGANPFKVSIPSSVYTVSAADVQRVLFLKSVNNPSFNSGAFLIQGVDIPNNAFTIDYRTADPGSSTFPPVETGGTSGMQWWLYSQDSSCPSTRGSNGGTGYKGYGTSTNSRIILQSVHSTAWQVRLCSEFSGDYNFSGPCAPNTAAPGFGGNASGDFPTGTAGGKHLHQPLFWDTLNTNQGADNTRAFMPGYGVGANQTPTPFRITIVADDAGRSVSMFLRHLNSNSNPQPVSVSFGIPDNEPLPLPTDNTRRLFVWGWINSGNNGNQQDIGWFQGRNDQNNGQGNGFGSLGVPISSTPGLWTYIEGNGQGGSPIYSGNAGDNPFLSGTELTEVDVWLGTQQNWAPPNGNSTQISYGYPLEPRLAGTCPFLRAGRANFTQYATTTDSTRAWYHWINGVFMTYYGPNPTP